MNEADARTLYKFSRSFVPARGVKAVNDVALALVGQLLSSCWRVVLAFLAGAFLVAIVGILWYLLAYASSRQPQT
jgi:ABC-type nitrate/sulfonate/bicarbonate transport system permease component